MTQWTLFSQHHPTLVVTGNWTPITVQSSTDLLFCTNKATLSLLCSRRHRSLPTNIKVKIIVWLLGPEKAPKQMELEEQVDMEE